MTFLSTMENSNSRNQRESKKPAIRTIVSCNSKQPEIRIIAAKETKTNAMETITTMKKSFCSYHQLCRHSDAKWHNPCNPKGVNANNTHHNDQNNNYDHNYQQDHNY